MKDDIGNISIHYKSLFQKPEQDNLKVEDTIAALNPM